MDGSLTRRIADDKGGARNDATAGRHAENQRFFQRLASCGVNTRSRTPSAPADRGALVKMLAPPRAATIAPSFLNAFLTG